MWAAFLFAVIWVAGMVIAKVVENTPEQIKANEAQEKAEQKAFEKRKFRLDALKALRESAFQRWDKRRSYEWQLSISIWTALAAFSALILNKDSPIPNSAGTALLVGFVGFSIAGVHWYYLHKMFTHTIGDAGILRWAEREIWMLSLEQTGVSSQTGTAEKTTGIPVFVPKVEACECQGDSKFQMYPNLSRYGSAQVAITCILVGAALVAVVSRSFVTQQSAPVPINYFFNQ